MLIAFRVDASNQIGTGHLMRCITLANSFEKEQAAIRFVARHMPDYLQKLIISCGFELCLLDYEVSADQVDKKGELAHAKWLGNSQLHDAKATKLALSDLTWDWLVVDHYALDSRWEERLRDNANKIMVIDDIADRNHDCDLLLDQNYYKNVELRYEGKVSNNCQLLLGPKYALLRKEFAKFRDELGTLSNAVKNILVFFGGVDALNYTGKTIQALSEFDELSVDVIIGASHPQREAIVSRCLSLGYNNHIQTDRVAELMVNADLVIGAGGTSTWEKFCLGLPTIALPTADNQIEQLNDLAECGFCYVVQPGDDVESELKLHIKVLTENVKLITFFARNSMSLVDGRGASRVATAMNGLSQLQLRRADTHDEKSIYEWRNHEVIRRVSKDKEIIEWSTHQSWFKMMLESESRILLIAEFNEKPIAVIRFDLQKQSAEVSIYLVQQESGRGFGLYVLKAAENWLLDRDASIKEFNATILSENYASHQLFKNAGYLVDSTCYRKVVY